MTTSMQCLLERNGDKQTVWLPKEFCIEDRYLRLKENGEWIDGWRVATVYPGEMASEYVQKHERAFAGHRKATDI